ncbi:hypothetical protein CRG98_039249, partial [Punica granatum]
MMHKEVEVYVDDMIAKSKEGEDHLVNWKRLFNRLKEYKLRLNLAKCTFGARLGKLLGFVVSERGIEVDPDKVKAIKELPPPSSIREVRGFLGRLNYIARFIANLTDKCQPLFRLLCKNAAIEWNEECQKAFDTIKAYLEDESTYAEHAIYYLSKMFTDGESNYPEIEKMCCPLVWVRQRLRQYTLYHTIRLLSKMDPLKYLLNSPSSMRNIAKWRCQLTEYDIEYVSCTSVKGQESQIIWQNSRLRTMYFDGAVNSMGSGIGAVLISSDGRYYPVAAKIDFSCTNNVVEYEFADELATLASMVSITKENLIEPLEIEIAKGPVHCNAIEASEAKPWYEDIKNFLRTGQYPPFADHRDRKTLRRLAIHYFLSGEILYRRSFDSTLLRCIDEHESRRLMEEMHGGSCGPHMNGLMLAKKIMRLGYYWSTMEIDCVKH